MPAKKFFILAEEKFRKSYLKEKKNKDVLFVYDIKNKPGKKDYDDLDNCLALDFSAITSDSKMSDNKEIIKKQLQILASEMKKYKDVVIPDTQPIGIKLAKKAPQSFKILVHKLKKYDITSSVETKKLQAKGKKSKKKRGNDNNNSVGDGYGGLFNTLGGKKKSVENVKKKKTKKQKEKDDKKARKQITKDLKEAHGESEACLMAHNLTKRKLYTSRSSSSKNYVGDLEAGLASCKNAMGKCKEINKNMGKVLSEARKEKLEIKVPLPCRVDHEGKSKVMRIKDELESTLISQIKILNI